MRSPAKTTLLSVLLLALSLPLAASKWTVDDVLLQQSASAFEISRDGQLVVWVQSRMNKKKGTSVSQLHLQNLAAGYTVQLTRGTASARAPKFSPDATRIAFLRSRQGAEAKPGGAKSTKVSQVWILDVRGGEPYQLTSFKKGVKAAAWLDDETLLVTATEDPSLYEQRNKEHKDTSNVVDDDAHAPPVRLFRVALKGKRVTRLTSNKDRIDKTYVSDDGAWAVTVHERSLAYEYNQNIRPVTFLHDLKNGTETQLFPDGKILPRNVQFTADGKGFYFTAPFTHDPKYLFATDSLLYYYDLGARRVVRVDLKWERHLGRSFTVTPRGVLALLADGVRYKPALFQKNSDGWSRTWVEGEHAANIFKIAMSRDGKTIVYDHSTASTPKQLYAASLAGNTIVDAKPITKLNPSFDAKLKAKTEIVHWKGANGDEVEGLLYYPHNYEAGKKYPLVLMIHGGPHGADMDRWTGRMSYPHQLFAQDGAFLLKPNYHGSGNYGLAWGESISGGNYNDLEWIDCDRGVDAMIDRGFVDPGRLGVMGWSNGSIITIEITTRTTRYKVASAGAGDVDWISDWANCQFGDAFDQYYLGGTPLDKTQLYIKKSPLFRMDKVTTPTIIFFGTIDRRVPTEQGWQHFRALQHLGKTDVKFILFPGEAHGPRHYGHQRRKVVEEQAWFNKYLFHSGATLDESLKPASPLAAALKLRVAGDTPETVERGQIRIGRFEVTRAQFAVFSPSYHYPAGTADHPANGISFEDAKAYCEWLAGKTGRKFRLGTEEEMAKLLKPSSKENTLDAWAAYPLNADDAAKLAAKVKQLGPGALLKPVGSSPGAGEDPVYDLGGNVAEWVVVKDGSGKPLGGSADRPADPKGTTAPSPDYIGFRVVEDL